MSKRLIILILAITGFCSCGQSSKPPPDKVTIDLETVDSTKNDNRQTPLTYNPDTYIYTDTMYTFSTGKGVIIQNSFPKGGGDIDGIRGYTDSTGKNHAYAIFWTSVINEATIPLELKINFPAEPFTIFSSPDSYLKLFLPPDIMTLDKLSLYNYGITGLKSFLDTNFNKPTMLQKTINPNEECLFYIAALSYHAAGTPRAVIVLKEQDLFYRISVVPRGSALIPCGQIVF
jgi:hypothetical protein